MVDFRAEINEQKYRIELLSEEYKLLFKGAVMQVEYNSDLPFLVRDDHIEPKTREFFASIKDAGRVDLDDASANDVASVLKYFTQRNKTLEEITDNVRWERIDKPKESVTT